MLMKSFTYFRFMPLIAVLAGALLSVSTLTAGPLPKNLGNGLRELLEQRQAQSGATTKTAPAIASSGVGRPGSMQFDQSGRVLVDILLDSAVPYEQTRASILANGGTQLLAEDRNYRGGVIEAYLAVDAVGIIARTPGVSAVHASLKPQFRVGAVTSQGVVQHRVDKIPQFDGAGITVGVISDTFNTAPGRLTRARDDIASGDLPADGVTIIQESGVGNDEGRAMCQVIHDMAPGARLGFATANGGEVNFANNIRSLAGLPDGTNKRPGFKADIVLDDTFYIDEPHYSDGISSRAIDEVAAAGVSYFTAAGNQPPTQSYDSDLRLVPFDPQNPGAALAGTNIDLSGVDPALYAGGFHNFNPNPGQQDIAQSLQAFFGVIILNFEWDDPYDVTFPPPLETLFRASGRARNDSNGNAIPVDFTFHNQVAGATDRIDLIGTSNQTSKRPVPLDATITVFGPNGKVVSADGEINPNLLLTFEKVGNYTIRILGNNFLTGDVPDTGPFTVKVSTVRDVPDLVTSDFNPLLFDSKGKFVTALASDNIANHRPVEVGLIGLPAGVFDYQLVLARANKPKQNKIASRLHYTLLDGGSFPTEYFSYFTPTLIGHAQARGAISVAAYSPFRPYIPESFTSPGPATIVFDDSNHRLDHPRIRLKPDVAAMDGANTTFFVFDTSRDLDTFPNFFGTSCAAPSAAGIGALVLQAHGGPGSVTPSQMRSVLQRSAFPHDLDPYFAQGVADVIRANGQHNGTVTVTAMSDWSFSNLGLVDPNENAISYQGPGSLQSITFHGKGGDVTGGSVLGSFPGLVFDPRPNNGDLITGGLPFAFGDSVGISRSNVSVSFSHPAPPPSQDGQFFNMTIQFTPGRFTSGDMLRYAIDRDEQHAAYSPPDGLSIFGDSADLLGGGVLIPQGKILEGGVTFEGTANDSGTFKGIMANRIGSGYSILDGFGFINAQKAVNEPLTTSAPIKQ
jgi:Subtilase family